MCNAALWIYWDTGDVLIYLCFSFKVELPRGSIIDQAEHVEVVISGFRALFLDFHCERHMSARSLSQDLFKCLELEEEEDYLFMDF